MGSCVIVSALYLSFVAWNKSPIIFTLGLTIALMVVISYNLTFFVNPGIPNRDLSIYDSAYLKGIINDPSKFCADCKIVKPPGEDIVHCSECNLCVIGNAIIRI
jgi:hypothetical protein